MHVCFFDIDGTLVLTGGAGQAAFAQTLAEEFDIPEIDTRIAFAGRSDRAIATDLFRSHGVECSPENWRRFCAGYLSRLEHSIGAHRGFVLPGALELLVALTERSDVAIGLLTGNIREGARRKLEHFGLWDRFHFGGFGDEHLDRCGIAATALDDARRHLNGYSPAADVANILVIGDTPHDIDCGRSIAARCVAVATGHTSASVLRQSRPDLLVSTLEDRNSILALLDD
jgi:phosphoglycolate phosphatase